MPIRILPETVAAQIAAGEVVERPASVVKELLENALDAGAGSIRIEVREGGQRLIRVSDDGSGIPAAEVPIAFHRHSTSKLDTAADLAAIHTLGFRGEALASIASVSQVTLVTRAPGETAGARLQVDGGKIHSQEAVGAPQGTMIGVENLFFNVPARLKFLRSKTTEKRHIDALVTRYALAYPAVRFRLTHGNRLTFQSPGSGNMRDVLIEVYGLDTARQMLEIGKAEPRAVKGESPPVARVRGYTSAPSLSRANRTQITFFVNGRWVQDSSLSYAVVQAYHTMLMTGRYPVSVIMVELPPEEVDVNVHPTKAEVRFREKNAIFGAVQRAVRRTLLESGPVRPAEYAGRSENTGWTAVRPPSEQISAQAALSSLRPVTHHQPPMELPGAAAGERVEQLPFLPDEQSPDVPLGARTQKLPMLRVVGQIGASFIVAEGPAGMVVIDQHAAHERILYEQFMAQKAKGIPTQTMLDAVPVDLSPDRAGLLEEQLETLADLGFVVEHFGGSTFMVRGLPAVLGAISPAAALESVADDLERGDKPLEGTIEEKIITRVCKTAAVKAGQVLTRQEMREMIRQLEACSLPHTCPHGRPTMIQMTDEQLAKQFERT